MRKWGNFREVSQISVFAKIFEKVLRKCRENFRENGKSIKFDSDTACMVHVVTFF
jgi:hypothetical protein